MAKELFGGNYRERILDLNASDERGIQVIRDKVKTFSQKKVAKVKESKADFQIVILDEADAMTKDAQSALRRVIEDNVKTTRFCIICNYVSKIIDPIASRCAKFKFSPLDKNSQIERLQFIAEKEGCKFEPFVYDKLQEISEGDLRKSINQMQSLSKLYSMGLNEDMIDDICGVIPKKLVRNLYEKCFYSNKETIYKETKIFQDKGYDPAQFASQLIDILREDERLDDVKRHKAALLIVNMNTNLCQGATAEMTYYGLLADLSDILRTKMF